MRSNKIRVNRQRASAYADILQTDNRGEVRVTQLHPNTVLKIAGRTFLAKDVPLTVYTLKCGHKDSGIAVEEKDLVFCDKCADNSHVVKVN